MHVNSGTDHDRLATSLSHGKTSSNTANIVIGNYSNIVCLKHWLPAVFEICLKNLIALMMLWQAIESVSGRCQICCVHLSYSDILVLHTFCIWYWCLTFHLDALTPVFSVWCSMSPWNHTTLGWYQCPAGILAGTYGALSVINTPGCASIPHKHIQKCI